MSTQYRSRVARLYAQGTSLACFVKCKDIRAKQCALIIGGLISEDGIVQGMTRDGTDLIK